MDKGYLHGIHHYISGQTDVLYNGGASKYRAPGLARDKVRCYALYRWPALFRFHISRGFHSIKHTVMSGVHWSALSASSIHHTTVRHNSTLVSGPALNISLNISARDGFTHLVYTSGIHI